MVINMDEFKLTTPVAFIIFNRPDTTAQVFEQIRIAKPSKLYLISDAPRVGREDDVEKVKETREYVESHIDWECEVHKNYAETNMGCKNRVYTGITWVLSQEDRTMILEDDVVPTQQFFRYCQEMLEYYKNNPRVMMVSGTNLQKSVPIKNQYTFSCFSSIWGWATWKRAWDLYDPDVKDWPEVDKRGDLKCVQSGFAYLFLKRNVQSVYTKKKDTWDIQWDYCRHKNRGLGVVPKENMITNIGFDRADATHTTGGSDEDFSVGEMAFPINFNVPVKRDVDYDRAYINKYYGMKKVKAFITKKIKGEK